MADPMTAPAAPEMIRAVVEKLANTRMEISVVEWSQIAQVLLGAADEIASLRASLASARAGAIEECARVAEGRDEMGFFNFIDGSEVAEALRALAPGVRVPLDELHDAIVLLENYSCQTGSAEVATDAENVARLLQRRRDAALAAREAGR